MKQAMLFFCLFLLTTFSYASISQNITAANNAFASSIQNGYASFLPEQVPSRGSPVTVLNATFFGISPAIDSRISSLSNNQVLYATAIEYEPVVRIAYVSSDQKCANEFETQDTITYVLGESTKHVEFRSFFRNGTKQWAAPADQPISSLQLTQNELEQSEFDTLQISLVAVFEIPYEARIVSMRFNRDVDPGSGAVSEGCDPWVEEEQGVLTYELVDSKNYTVESTKSLMRTVAPALKEQWFRNNHFDSLIFSNRLFYQAHIDNATSQWYTFNMTQDAFGYSTGISIPYLQEAGMKHEEHIGVVSPYLLDRTNSTYGVAYLFNYSFLPQTGLHSMNLTLTDHFGNTVTHGEILASRGIRTATAHEFVGNSFERPFADERIQTVGVFTLSIGVLGLVFLLGALPRISSL